VLTYDATGLTNGTNYCFTVRAVNAGGESVDSDPACATPTAVTAPVFRRGDANADGKADLTDAIYILGWLYQGGKEPPCQDAADANDDGKVDLTDAIYILSYLYQGGKPPPAPGAKVCGPDTTPSPKITKPCVYNPPAALKCQ